MRTAATRRIERRTPEESGSLSEQAYQRIRAEILFYQLAPGSRLSEASLTERFSLRLAAVRSALVRLVQEGLVEKADERTARVAPLTLKDVRDVYGLRLMLEPRAAALAAEGGVPAVDLQRLHALAESHYEFTNHRELVAFLKANREFNLLVANHTGNARLAAVLTHLQDLTLRILYVGIKSLNVSEWFHTTHVQIAAAIGARDGARAAQLWETDLRYGERLISDALLKLPELSGVNLGGASLGAGR
ncbi:MAG: GntR family transcriptional regulator [Gammaproteobacteria bacterium]|nr:GntR family transcriptional regulator [Gammaproteobacteria bacterium]